MKLIVACDPKGGIGYNNKLPWSKIEGDLPRFKALTTDKNVVMGKRSWESLPIKPLPNRNNYVLSRVSIPGAVTMGDVKLLLNTAGNDAWVIGGGNVIAQCWEMIDEIHLTRTIAEYTCDTFIDLVKLEKEFTCWFKEQHMDHSYEIWKRK
jgi:dihydrofolate reductase